MRRNSVWHRCNFVSVDFSHSDGSHVLFQVLMLNRHLVHVHDSPTSVMYSQQQFSRFCGCLQCHFNLLYRARHQRCAKPSNSCLTILHKLVTCSFHLLLFTRPQFTIGYTFPLIQPFMSKNPSLGDTLSSCPPCDADYALYILMLIHQVGNTKCMLNECFNIYKYLTLPEFQHMINTQATSKNLSNIF